MTPNGSAVKPYKGMGMNGFVARWYASLTSKSMDEYKALARRTASQIPPNATVLEVAPGPGYFAVELAKLGNFHITGLDISKTFVEIARANAANAGIRVDFRQGNASRMPFPDDSFDFLICSAAFKNFTEPQRALEEMHRVLKPGGQALIVDLRRDATMDDINQAINGMKVGPVNGMITKLTFRYMLLKRAYTKCDFEQMIARTKFQASDIREDLFKLEIILSKQPAKLAFNYF
jgi:ubiquinone/menaquinone biosynthesis C-methylase UbiE